MYLAYLGHKEFDLPQTISDLTYGAPVKHFMGLFAYLNFTFGDEYIDIAFDDKEFNDFVKDYQKYEKKY